MHDVARRTDVHRDPQSELGRLHAERTQSRLFFSESHGRHDARRARRALRVDLDVPRTELLIQIFIVDEASLLEEAALDPADEVLDRALLLGAPRPAQLDGEPEVEDHVAEDRIPLDDRAVLVPRQRDRLGPVEDREQRKTTPRSEVIDHRAHQRLDLLVRHEAHLHPARVLQPRGEEVHALLPPVEKPHVDVPEVVLREFAGEALEPDDGARPLRPEVLDQRVQRALAATVALQLRAAEQFHREHVGLRDQLGDEELAKRVCLRRPADAAPCPLSVGIEVSDSAFSVDALDRSL
nr:hypothetical protein [Kofleriaceae bacterium]